jgi:hypothetical protein
MICALAGTVTAVEPGAGFWKQWGDGQAELAAYDLTIPRYSQPRRGVAVTIFVAEPFSKSARVKADPGKHPAADETPVMKLNLVKDYQTGVYDYNEMWSTFIDTATARPLKTSFSRQEWCGHVYKQLLWDPGQIRATLHSYFDGEADQNTKLDNPGGLSEDSLLLWARGIAEPKLKPGESRHTPFLSSLGAKGLPLWTPATASRATAANGQEVWSVKAPAGTWSITVEAGGEGKILGWSFPGGEEAKLIKSTRMKYWELNSPAGEAALTKLGLRVRPPRTM